MTNTTLASGKKALIILPPPLHNKKQAKKYHFSDLDLTMLELYLWQRKRSIPNLI
jgi:hypothetical protein